jgi:hypothetical protein
MTPEEREVLCLLLNEPNIHRDSAFHFVRQANTIYDALLAKKPSEQIDALFADDYRQMQIYTFGAVLAAVSFLEAQINDFFGRCKDDGTTEGALLVGEKLLTYEDVEAIHAATLPKGFRRKSTLERYKLLLEAARRQPFDVESETYKAVEILVKFRHFLAHYQYEGAPLTAKEAKEIRDVLESMAIMPLLHAGFPDSFLIGPTATWAVNTVTDFFVLFCKHLYDGSPSQLRHIGD